MAGLDDPLKYKDSFKQHTGYEGQANEIEMYDNQMAEMMAISGLVTEYYPIVADENKDPVFGEDTLKNWPKKYLLTCLLADGTLGEELVYTNFEELNREDFIILIHKATFLRQTNGEYCKPGDVFFLPNNSEVSFEITHVEFTALGENGNIFGQQNVFKLNCREFSSTAMNTGIGETFGVVDEDGNLLPNAPADALLDDGRVRDKYSPRKPERHGDEEKDNREIDELANDQKIYQLDEEGEYVLDEEGNPIEIIKQGIIKTKASYIDDLWGDW